MFGRRPDGTQVRQLSAMRRLLSTSRRAETIPPSIGPEIEIDAAPEFLEKKPVAARQADDALPSAKRARRAGATSAGREPP
jgi:hypothetical protein